MKPEDIVKQEALLEPELSAVEEAVEKRTHARISVSLNAEIVATKTGVRITGRATDVGTGGCYVETMNIFPKDTPVDVFFLWQERTLLARICRLCGEWQRNRRGSIIQRKPGAGKGNAAGLSG